VQIEIVLRLELERPVRRFEEGEARSICELIERMQNVGGAAGLGRANLDGLNQGQAEETLIEHSSRFRVPAAIGDVMELLDHGVAALLMARRTLGL
jgi:hypothetical protein